MNSLLYFAYGSNMSERRLLRRLPGAQKIGIASCPNHQVIFHKIGFRDDSAKFGLIAAEHGSWPAHGVVFTISKKELATLDAIEGVGCGYTQTCLTLRLADGSDTEAISYIATRFDKSLLPFHWYKHHVLTGAMENRLPADYIQLITELRSKPDPDTSRHHAEMAIYG